MNFLKGAYEISPNGNAGIRLTDGSLVPVLPARGATANQAVTLGARPEHITILADETGGNGGIPARVELIEPMGLSTLVHVSLAGNPVKIFTLDRPDFAVDSFIHIAFDMEKVHVFDTKTELRLPPENEPHTAQSA